MLAVVVSISRLSVARRSANSMSMKFRHAATLALVRWYLMVPLSQSDCSRSGITTAVSILLPSARLRARTRFVQALLT